MEVLELEVEEIEVHPVNYYTWGQCKPVLKDDLTPLIWDGTVSPDVYEEELYALHHK